MYQVTYQSEVVQDIAGLGAMDKRRIKAAIETKLSTDPIRFGKPLQHSLRGLRSLRVVNYRVIYVIQGATVLVVLIAHRSVVYERVIKRR